MSKIVETELIEKKKSKPIETNFEKIVSKIQDIVTSKTSQTTDETYAETIQKKYLDLVSTYNVNAGVPEKKDKLDESDHSIMDQPKLSFRKRTPSKKKYNSIWNNPTPTPEPVNPSELVDSPKSALDYPTLTCEPVDPSEFIDFSESALDYPTLTYEPDGPSKLMWNKTTLIVGSVDPRKSTRDNPILTVEPVDPISITTDNLVLTNYPLTNKAHGDSKT